MPVENEKLVRRVRRNLQEFRLAFTDIRFDTALSVLPEAVQKRAARARFAAALAVQRIDNDGFEAIARRLAAEAPAIQAGIARLDDALDDLARARAIIDAVASTLNLVGPALGLVGITLPV